MGKEPVTHQRGQEVVGADEVEIDYGVDAALEAEMAAALVELDKEDTLNIGPQ